MATSNLSCSFCGKHQSEVRKLIAGPSVYICDECVELSKDILDEEMASRPAPVPSISATAILDSLAAIVGQRQAKRALAEAFVDYKLEQRATGHVLLAGPIGAGKTRLVEAAAAAAGLPVSFVEAVHLSSDRYLNRSDVFEDLFGFTDTAKPALGIVCVERLDWIAIGDANREQALQAQAELLAMMSGRNIRFRNRTGTVDTSSVLFVCTGVFPGVDLGSTGVEALCDHGLMPELVARLRTVGVLEALDEDERVALVGIALHELIARYAKQGVELSIDPLVAPLFARALDRRGDGAHGLASLVDGLAVRIRHALAGTDVGALVVDTQMAAAMLERSRDGAT